MKFIETFAVRRWLIPMLALMTVVAACGGSQDSPAASVVTVASTAGGSVPSAHIEAFAPISALTIFPVSDAGHGCYRIPAVVTLPDSSILVFAEGQPSGCPDFGSIQVVMRRSTDGGTT